MSNAPMQASNTGPHPKGMDIGNESKILGHFSDALDEMAQCIMELEDGYFMALWEVIRETEKALHQQDKGDPLETCSCWHPRASFSKCPEYCLPIPDVVWQMIGDECICPLRAKHSDWCGLAGIVQAIVKTFANNCTSMFPPAPPANAPFSSNFKPASSYKEDDDNGSFGHGSRLCRFSTDSPTPSGGGCGGLSGPPSYSSTPLPQGGHFFLASDQKAVPSSSLGAPLADDEEAATWPFGKELDLGLEADDEGDGEKNQPGGNDSVIDIQEIKILQGIVNPGPGQEPLSMP